MSKTGAEPSGTSAGVSYLVSISCADWFCAASGGVSARTSFPSGWTAGCSVVDVEINSEDAVSCCESGVSGSAVAMMPSYDRSC